VAPPGYLAAAREITRERGALLWLDEIQTGIGRTGGWFAHPADLAPDIVTLAKGLGGGVPIGACIGLGDAAFLLEPGNHGTTFGGNPVACAAGLAVLHTIESEGLLDHASKLGEHLSTGLAEDPRVTEVRGAGLLIGLSLSAPVAAAATAAALQRGFLLNNPTPDRIRLAPPLVLTRDDADAFLGAWPGILDDAFETTEGAPA
jgi:acetylornithine/N-succinyldiaminopimelate aminotransferase